MGRICAGVALATHGARETMSSPPLTSRTDPLSDWSGPTSRFQIELARAVPFQLIHFQAGASWLGQGIRSCFHAVRRLASETIHGLFHDSSQILQVLQALSVQ